MKDNLLNSIIQRSGLYLKKNSTTILSVLGVGGVVATAIMSAKATPKAIDAIREGELEKDRDLTLLERVNYTGLIYLPTVMVGAGSIACIIGANVLNKKKQASLASAYIMLDKGFKEYRKKVNEVYGDDADYKVKERVVRDRYKRKEISKGNALFYEPISERYFESTIDIIKSAECNLNRIIAMSGHAKLNDLFNLLNLDGTNEGEVLGWSECKLYEDFNYSWVDIGYDKMIMDDGLECIMLRYIIEPSIDFLD